jgi:multimeric flavodoxin WrbA
MHVVCISASNIKHAGVNSTSYKVCKIICDLIDNDFSKDIIKLVDYEFAPCIGCGQCYKEDKCFINDEFNHVYSRICRADALFIVSAHYAPIPSKLSIVLEKMEQLAFLKRFNTEAYRSPLFKKPVGLIGHGGGGEEIYKHYKKPVLDSIWNALSYPIEMNIIGIDEENEKGITFPVKAVKKAEYSIFPIQEYDWEDISARVKPLVNNVLECVRP